MHRESPFPIGAMMVPFVLFRCKHEDSEHQLGFQEHLDEECLDYSCVASNVCSYCQWAREEDRADGSRGDSTNNLGNQEEDTSNIRKRSN